MILLMDIGNSNSKIGVVIGGEVMRTISVKFSNLLNELNQLSQLSQFQSNKISAIWIAISHQSIDKKVFLAKLSKQSTAKIHLIQSQPKGYGVQNAYPVAKNLGVDRWLSLIYAHHTIRQSCAIISCGTFITFDEINATGQHLGGLISLGLTKSKQVSKDIIIESVNNTTKTPMGFTNADNTKSAINAGCNFSFVATVQQLIQRTKSTEILLTGGDSKYLKPFVSDKIKWIDNIPIKGLLIIAKLSNAE